MTDKKDNKVVSILDRMPHLSGNAMCLHCKHKWVAVAPTGTIALFECPECGLDKGVFVAAALPEEYYACSCGNHCYCVSSTHNLVCTLCGKVSTLLEIVGIDDV